MILGFIILAVIGLFVGYQMGIEEARTSEAEKQFNKCKKCERDGINNVD